MMRHPLLIGAMLLSACMSEAEAFKDPAYKRGRGGSDPVGAVEDLGIGLINLGLSAARPFVGGCYGQSQCLGHGTEVSTTQPYSNVRRFGGALTPLIEPAPGSSGESPVSAAINQITFLRPANLPGNIATVAAAASGTAIIDMSIGDATFINFAAAVEAAAGVDPTLKICLVNFIQGESDVGVTNRATYLARLQALRTDLTAQIVADGNLDPACDGLIFMMSGIAGWTDLSLTDNSVLLATQDACLADPNHFMCSTTLNHLTYGDDVHLDAAGDRKFGQLLGLADEAIWRGRKWSPLMMRKAVAEGNNIRTCWRVPCLFNYPAGEQCSGAAGSELSLDLATVSDRTLSRQEIRNGFRITTNQTVGIRPLINAVTFAGSGSGCDDPTTERAVMLELSSPAPTDTVVGYMDIAQTLVAGAGCTNASHGLGAGCNAAGNLRAATSITSQSGSNDLSGFAWPVMAEYGTVTGESVALQLSQITNATALDTNGGGVNYGLSVADNAAMECTTEWTLYFEINAQTQVANNILFSKAVGSGTSNMFILRQDSADTTDLLMTMDSASNIMRCTSCNFAIGTTYGVAIVYRGAGSTTVNVNDLGAGRLAVYAAPVGSPMVAQTITMTSGLPATLTNSTAPFMAGFATGAADVLLDNIAWWCSARRQAELSGINTAHAAGGSVNFVSAVNLTAALACYTSEGDTALAVNDSCSAGTFNGTKSAGALRIAGPI